MTPTDFKAARLRLDLTQAELAARLGYTTRAIIYWETDPQRSPVPIAVQKLMQLWLDKPRKMKK